MSVKRKIIAILAVICLAVLTCGVLIACHKQEDTYTLTYAAGAADAQGTVPEIKKYKEGEIVTLLSSDTFTRIGYEFKKWSDGENEYSALQEFTMPAKNVTMTAVWEQKQTEEDNPTLTELASKFYDADNWEYMTNNGGASLDGGDVPFSLADGSIKFHRANQAIDLGATANGTMSFMLKGTNDWAIWLNSDSIDNRDNHSYRLVYKENKLGIAVSSVSDSHAAVVSQSTYRVAEWNRIDVAFETVDNVCSIKLYVNGQRASLVRGTIGATEEINVSKNVLKHTQGAGFETGGYAVVKVWEAHNYLQIKPVAQKDVEDVPIIACIGASITEGAGANNFYTESYPAQLQRRLGADYNVINFGNSGKTVREDLTDGNGNSVAWLAQYQWQGVQKIVPDMAILNIGTNDSKSSNEPLSTHDSFKQAYNHLLDELLQVNPDMEIYICTVPTAYTNIWGISESNINSIIAPVQREIALEREFTLIDLYNYSQNKSLLFGDGVHPNSHGYTMFVDIIEEVLTGDGTLSTEFLNQINEKYNDNGKIDNVSAVISKESGKLYLTVSGDTTMSAGDGLKVYVGDGKGADHYYPASISEGKFSVKIDFATLKDSSNWYNVRVYCDEYSHRIVLMDNTQYANGDKFSADDARVTVHTWNTNWGASFSFTVAENYNTEITSSTVTVVGGKLTLTVAGTTDAETLSLSVSQDPKDDSKSNFSVDAAVVDNAFTATFDLTQLNDYTGWYNARIYHDDGSYVPLGYAQTTDGENALAVDDVLVCDNTILIVQSWNDGGVETLSFSVKLSQVKLTEASLVVDSSAGTAILSVSGSTIGPKLVHDTTLLYLGNNANDAANFQALVEDANGNWSGSVDLASLNVGTGYEIRIYTRDKSGENYGGWYTIKIGEVKCDGEVVEADTEYELGNIKITVYDDVSSWDPFRVKVENTSVDTSFAVSSMRFEDGKFIVEGTCGVDVTNFVIHLHNTNSPLLNYEKAATIEEGTFKVEFVLSEIKNTQGGEPPQTYINVRYEINDDGYQQLNLLPETNGSYVVGQEYRYGNKTWTLKADSNRTYLNWSNVTDKYRISDVSLAIVDGKPTLSISGTTTEAIAADQLTLLLDKNKGTAQEQKTITNDATEASTFSFTIDLSDLIASVDTEDATQQQAYFIRLYNGETKLADINSRWASDLLWERGEIETDSARYFLMKNSAWSSTNWNTLGIVKVDKEAE